MPMNRIRERIEAQKSADEGKLRRAISEAAPHRIAHDLGIVGKYGDLLKRMAAEYSDGAFSAEDIDVWVKLDEGFSGLDATGEATIAYGQQMGIIVPAAGVRSSDERKAQFVFTRFATKGLSPVEEAGQ